MMSRTTTMISGYRCRLIHWWVGSVCLARSCGWTRCAEDGTARARACSVSELGSTYRDIAARTRGTAPKLAFPVNIATPCIPCTQTQKNGHERQSQPLLLSENKKSKKGHCAQLSHLHDWPSTAKKFLHVE